MDTPSNAYNAGDKRPITTGSSPSAGVGAKRRRHSAVLEEFLGIMECNDGDGEEEVATPPPTCIRNADARQSVILREFLNIIECEDEVAMPNATHTRTREQTPEYDTYQRVVHHSLEHQQIATPRATTFTENPPMCVRELQAMHKNTHDIAAVCLIKKVIPDQQRTKPKRRCDSFTPSKSIEATLNAAEIRNLDSIPRTTLVEEDFQRQGGPTSPTDATSSADPRKTYLANDLLLSPDVMGAIIDADPEDPEDVEMIDAIGRMQTRAETLKPQSERATIQRELCKSIIVCEQDESDRRVAAASKWIKHNDANSRYMGELMRRALNVHSLSEGIRMHRVRYAQESGRTGEEIRPLPLHLSAFSSAPNATTPLFHKVMLPRAFEESVLLRAAIPELKERPCANGIACQAYVISLDIQFQLREFVSPQEQHAFIETGEWAHLNHEAPRFCLLCMRYIINSAYHAALGAGKYMDNSSYPLGNICNYTDRAGEYCGDDCISNNLTYAGLIGPLVRHTLSRYSVVRKRITLPDYRDVEVMHVEQHGMKRLRTEAGRELHFRQGSP